MSTIVGLFRKRPKTSPIVSRPILIHTESFESYYQEDEKHGHMQSILHLKDVLPPRPVPPPKHRLLVFVYTTIALLSLTSIILFSIAIPLWNKNFIHSQSPIKTDWPDTLILAPLTLSTSSSIYLLATSLHPRRRMNAPGPFNLILLASTLTLSLTPALILVSNNTLAHAFSTTIPKPAPTPLNPSITTLNSNSNPACNLSNILTRPCLPIMYQIGELQIAGIALSSLVGVSWLFILALSTLNLMKQHAEARRRKEERRRQRHARRRGHERRHGHSHRSKRDGGHREKHHEAARGKEGSGRVGTKSSSHDRSRTKGTLVASWEGSNAVRYAQQKVRPKESIQTWLADRQV